MVEDEAPAVDDRPTLVTGVTTFNRLDYLKEFVNTYSATRSNTFRHVLVVADDGSFDGTIEWLASLQLADTTIVKVFNRGRGIAGQSNSVLQVAEAFGEYFLICCNDDVVFTSPGWDVGYAKAARDSGLDHLVYFDADWKPASFASIASGGLVANVGAEDVMGALWTATPRVVAGIGFFDEPNFPVRGHSHIDYTVRACRLGANYESAVMDWSGGPDHVSLQKREGYVETFDWGSPTAEWLRSDEEKDRRWALIRDQLRLHVPPHTPSEPPTIAIAPVHLDVATRLAATGMNLAGPWQPGLLGTVFVLNLSGAVDRFVRVAGELARLGLWFERLPGVDGSDPGPERAHGVYASLGPQTPHERRIHRRLLQSRGAWGYLESALALLVELRSRRIHKGVLVDDDVAFSLDAGERLAHLGQNLWSLAYLGGSRTDLEGGSHAVGLGGIVRSDAFSEPLQGSFAVAIGGDAIGAIWEGAVAFDGPFDSGSLHRYWRSNPEKVAVLWPPVAVADVSTSAIRESRDMATFAERVGWDLARFPTLSVATPTRRGTVVVDGTDAGVEAISRTLESLRGQKMADFVVRVVGRDADKDALTRFVLRDGRASLWLPGCGRGGAMPVVGEWSVMLSGGDVVTPGFLEAVVLGIQPVQVLASGEVSLAGRLGGDPEGVMVELEKMAAGVRVSLGTSWSEGHRVMGDRVDAPENGDVLGLIAWERPRSGWDDVVEVALPGGTRLSETLRAWAGLR